MKTQISTCSKIKYQKHTFEHKLFVIDQIQNCQISVNYAAKKYDISRSSINYWIKKYATFAQENNLIMSMTEQYDPYENAITERINRTLKYEYGLKNTIKTRKLAKKMVDQTVYIYIVLLTCSCTLESYSK